MPVIPAPGTPAYKEQMAHWDDDIRPQAIAGCAIMIVASTATVVLRMVSQRLYTKGWTPSDWLIVVAWVIAMGIAAQAIVSYAYGFGLHQLRVILSDKSPPHDLVLAFENGSFISFAWVPCLACVKLSLLLYYRRLFQVHQKWLQTLTWIMFAYVVAWAIASTPVLIFQCSPVSFFWNRMAVFYGIRPTGLHGKCLPQLAHLAAPSITSTFSDIVIWGIPILVLVRLQMDLRRKLGFVALFSLGAFVVATGCIRIYYVFRVSNVDDVTWNDIGTVTWTVVECCTAIVCASIPPSVPLLKAGLKTVGLRRPDNSSPGRAWRSLPRRRQRMEDSDVRMMRSAARAEKHGSSESPTAGYSESAKSKDLSSSTTKSLDEER